jgi:alkylation response protein AidB-like acyl-CoA dehydrogenase
MPTPLDLIPGVGSFFATIRTGLIVGSSAFVIGGASGAFFMHEHDMKSQIKQAQAAASRQAAAQEAQDEKDKAARLALQVKNIAAEQNLDAARDGLRHINARLQEILNAKPDPDPGCHLRLGDIRLLNDAAASGDPAPGLPDPAAGPAYQEQTPSSVSCRAFVSTEIAIRQQYRDLAAQNDAKTDWMQSALINSQLDTKASPK